MKLFQQNASRAVLGTVQLGMDYGIANKSGKPKLNEAQQILDLAWESGIRSFDTAPNYGSEKILGEFVSYNGLQNSVRVLTKIPSIKQEFNFMDKIKKSIHDSVKNLKCPIEVLFFHNTSDFTLIEKNPKIVEQIKENFPVRKIGVSAYDNSDVLNLFKYFPDIVVQFPYNILDTRFNVKKVMKGNRYARSIFLQGLLVSPEDLSSNTLPALRDMHRMYHLLLSKNKIDPIELCISYIHSCSDLDYFLFGVDSLVQLEKIIDMKVKKTIDFELLKKIKDIVNPNMLDPRNWRKK